MSAKPYWVIPIIESQEPLAPMPPDAFVYATPHPYVALGAPYGDASPFFMREGVLSALLSAQQTLQAQHPHWQLFIFDAYRPVAVQKFMVELTFAELLTARNLELSSLSPVEAETLWTEVYQFWAPSNLDPKTPPPHSTGAAVDLTLFDTQAQEIVWMGSPIDEVSARSQPDYFGNLVQNADLSAIDRENAELAHRHRQILDRVMTQAGFRRHPGEWWHFSLGDQFWAWLGQQASGKTGVARYGRVE